MKAWARSLRYSILWSAVHPPRTAAPSTVFFRCRNWRFTGSFRTAFCSLSARSRSDKTARIEKRPEAYCRILIPEGDFMIQRLSHATIFVLDQEAAKDFYVNKLGFDLKMDASMETVSAG